MLQNAEVQRRVCERKSEDVSHRLSDSEVTCTKYQVTAFWII